MRYDVNGIAGERFPAPCKVYDARGAHIPFVRRCDTETGEVARCLLGPDGRFVLSDEGYATTVAEVHPAPLRVEQLPCS